MTSELMPASFKVRATRPSKVCPPIRKSAFGSPMREDAPAERMIAEITA
jgi:hypothetical protein